MRRKKEILSVEKAQEIIMDFLKDYFRQDQISLVENIIKTCPVNIIDKKTMNKNQDYSDEIFDKIHMNAYA